MNKLLPKLNALARLARFDRPVGTLLLAWYSLWGLWLAGRGHPPARVVFIFLLGTFLMRSAGCVFNDLADRNFDGHVARTQDRPLARGELSARTALIFGLLLLAAAASLLLGLNGQSLRLSLLCAALAVVYPFCKRFLPAPQVVLGMAFASAILFAQTAVLGTITAAGGWLFAAGVVWALVYDTYYALVDRDDDRRLGLRSSALLAGRHEHAFIAVFALLMLCFLTLAGRAAQLGGWYFLGVLVAALLLGYQLLYTRARDRTRYFRAFVHNNWVGAAVFAGLVLSFLP